MKKIKGKIDIYETERRPMYYGCSATIMAALQCRNPYLSDETAYYASLMHWSFFFDQDKGILLGIPADELMHRNLLHLYGITRGKVCRDDFDALWRAIEELIEQDRVAVAWVDAHDVDDQAFHYNRMPGHSELMVIYGYDRKADELGIIVAPQRFQGCVPLSCLSDILVDNFVYDYVVPKNLILWPADRARQLLQIDIMEMRNGREMGSIKTGFPAVQCLIEEMKTRAEQPEDILLAWMKSVFEQMTFVGPQRAYLGYTLQRLADLYGEGELADCAQIFIRIGQSWEVARNMFFKGLKREPKTILPRIRKRIEIILIQEQEQAQFLQNWLGH